MEAAGRTRNVLCDSKVSIYANAGDRHAELFNPPHLKKKRRRNYCFIVGKIALLDTLISPSRATTASHLPPCKPILHPSTFSSVLLPARPAPRLPFPRCHRLRAGKHRGLINHCYTPPALFADTPLSHLTLLSNPFQPACRGLLTSPPYSTSRRFTLSTGGCQNFPGHGPQKLR